MTVAIAITITLPNTTAAKITATGTDFAQALGPEVARLVQNEVDAVVPKALHGVVTWSASVT